VLLRRKKIKEPSLKPRRAPTRVRKEISMEGVYKKKPRSFPVREKKRENWGRKKKAKTPAHSPGSPEKEGNWCRGKKRREGNENPDADFSQNAGNI